LLGSLGGLFAAGGILAVLAVPIIIPDNARGI